MNTEFQLKLQAHSVADQAIEDWRAQVFVFVLQRFGLNAQRGQRRFDFMREAGKKFFDLARTAALFEHEPDQCAAAEDQQQKPASALPKHHALLAGPVADALGFELREQ